MSGQSDTHRPNALMFEHTARIQQQTAEIDRLAREITSVAATIELSRKHYNSVLAERDQLREQAKQAELRLTEVQRVVARYAVVEEPVVASDGFTYERRIIQNYLTDCRQSKSEAISQQTKEVLTETLLPNQSLRKFVDLLKEVRPESVPAMSERLPIPAFESASRTTTALAGLQLGAEPARPPVRVENDGAVLASDLEASWTAKAKQGMDREREPAKDAAAAAAAAGGRTHPCIRVYGYCNYKDDCAFARYPYDACLNNIKGKCRFGSSCKELHVNPNDAKFRNPKAAQSLAQAVGQANRGGGSAGGSPNPGQPEDKRRSQPRK